MPEQTAFNKVSMFCVIVCLCTPPRGNAVPEHTALNKNMSFGQAPSFSTQVWFVVDVYSMCSRFGRFVNRCLVDLLELVLPSETYYHS